MTRLTTCFGEIPRSREEYRGRRQDSTDSLTLRSPGQSFVVPFATTVTHRGPAAGCRVAHLPLGRPVVEEVRSTPASACRAHHGTRRPLPARICWRMRQAARLDCSNELAVLQALGFRLWETITAPPPLTERGRLFIGSTSARRLRSMALRFSFTTDPLRSRRRPARQAAG
jgi:hypothetical protein